jgi:hypothetical protein
MLLKSSDLFLLNTMVAADNSIMAMATNSKKAYSVRTVNGLLFFNLDFKLSWTHSSNCIFSLSIMFSSIDRQPLLALVPFFSHMSIHDCLIHVDIIPRNLFKGARWTGKMIIYSTVQ